MKRWQKQQLAYGAAHRASRRSERLVSGARAGELEQWLALRQDARELLAACSGMIKGLRPRKR